MKWQPIETAPIDGTEILAGAESWIGVPYPVTSKFIDGKWATVFDGKWLPYEPQPTHWMPLPEPPEDNGDDL